MFWLAVPNWTKRSLVPSFTDLLCVPPLAWRLAVHTLEFSAELRGADVAHIQGSLIDGRASCDFHGRIVEAHGFHKLDGRHGGGVFELAMEHRPAHARARGHIVDGDGLGQI